MTKLLSLFLVLGQLVEKIGKEIEESTRSTIPYLLRNHVVTPEHRMSVTSEEEEIEDASRRSLFDTGKNTHGVIIPVGKKKLKKLLMFYYISRKYPRFVSHLLKSIKTGGRHRFRHKAFNESIAKFVSVDDANEDDDRYYYNNNSNPIQGDGRVDRIMSDLVDTSVQLSKKKARNRKHRGKLAAVNDNIIDEDDGSGKLDIIMSNLLDTGVRLSKKEGRKRKIEREFEELNMLLGDDITERKHSNNTTNLEVNKFRNNPVNQEVNQFRMYSSRKGKYRILHEEDTPSEKLPERRIIHKTHIYTTTTNNNIDPYASIISIPRESPSKDYHSPSDDWGGSLLFLYSHNTIVLYTNLSLFNRLSQQNQ